MNLQYFAKLFSENCSMMQKVESYSYQVACFVYLFNGYNHVSCIAYIYSFMSMTQRKELKTLLTCNA